MRQNPAFVELTQMEIACLRLAADGVRSAAIARQFDSPAEDIQLHLESARDKLGARNMLHAIGLAVSQGLIGIERS